MKSSLRELLVIAVIAAAVAFPLSGVAGEEWATGRIQAYDGKTVLILGKQYRLSDKARTQLETELKSSSPANGQINLTIQFIPKNKDGKPYIESVHIPRGEA